MSFGFSVGDFLAVGTLIVDISRCLADSGGSKSEYQELLTELDSLQHALVHLDKLQSRGSASTNVDSIKYTALSCRRPLECFLAKIRKYDKSLGVWSTKGKIKTVVHKLGWALGQKDEIRKLQGYLNVHVGTINILLAEHGLEMMQMASEQAEAKHSNIRDRLDDTRSIVRWIKDNLSAQTMAVNLANSMLSRLFDMVSGEFRTSLETLETMAVKVCISTQQIYGVLLEIKSSRDLGDARWTFFQAPLMIEDALGRKFPVPSEYDYSLLDAIIKHRFQEGPGCLGVKVGNYELFKAKDSKQVLSSSTQLLPGTCITMAMLLHKPELTDSACPMPRCGSERSTPVAGGGRVCCECDVWFEKSSKKRKALQLILDVLDEQERRYRQQKRKFAEIEDGESPLQRTKVSGCEDHSELFRNVKWTVELTVPAGIMRTFTSRSQNSPVLNDALSYLDRVRADYPEDFGTYNQFIHVMKAWKAELVDYTKLLDHVFHLFFGNEELLNGFEIFLPPGMKFESVAYNPDFLATAATDYRMWSQMLDPSKSA